MHSREVAKGLTEMARLILLQSTNFDLVMCVNTPLKYKIHLTEEVGIYKLSALEGAIEIVLALANTKVLRAVSPTLEINLEELAHRVKNYINSLPTEVVMGSFSEDWTVFHATFYSTCESQQLYKPIDIGIIREAFSIARKQKSWPAVFPPIDDQLLPYAFHCATSRGYIQTIQQRQVVVYNG